MRKHARTICVAGLGIALYIALSFVAKIPLVGHISLDLGYIVLAVYAYYFGPAIAAIVGGCGCVLVSLLASGWFPFGWLLGNIAIGIICGKEYSRGDLLSRLIVTILAVLFGVAIVKTAVECLLFSIPLMAKLPKNAIAAAVDAIAMVIGLLIAPKIKLGERQV